MLIDCDGCARRDLACEDCVVTVLRGGPPGTGEKDDAERRALDGLDDSGLVPRLRLVPLGLPGSAGRSPGPDAVPDSRRDRRLQT